MSGTNGRVEAFHELDVRQARIEAARILSALVERQKQGCLTDAEEIALADALADYIEAMRWVP